MMIHINSASLGRRVVFRLVLVCVLFVNSATIGSARGQVNGDPLFVSTLLNGFNPLMSLSGIEIPVGAKIGCSPFSRVRSSESRLTLSTGGTYLNDVVILTGRPADVATIARLALGETQPMSSQPMEFLGQYARSADTPEKIQQLLRYSQQTVSLYRTGIAPGGQPRPVLDAVKDVLKLSLQMYASGAIAMPVFADLNYVTGFPAVTGNPWGIEGSPWGIEGSPWGIEGSPWGIEGSPIVGSDAEKLAVTQSIAEGAFWRQWAFQDRGVGIYDAAKQRVLPDTADGTGSKVVLFDTAPYTTAGLKNETRQRLSINLCVHLVPLPSIDSAGDKSGYLRDHGLFGTGLTFATAPKSELHLVRVLDDNAVGDLYSLVAGIDGFNQSMLLQNLGTLRRVVYNFSLGLKPIGAEVPTEVRDLTQELLTLMPVAERPELVDGLPLLSLEIPLRTAYNLGGVLIASAGNDSAGLATPANQNVPAAYSFVLGVQSTNMDQRQSCYSNSGEVGAPGGNGGITPNCEPQLQLCNATQPCDYGLVGLVSERSDTVGFAYWVGSSFAAPLVSGVAADALENGVTYDKAMANVLASAAKSGVVDAEVAVKP